MRVYGTRRCGFIAGAEMIAPRAENMAHLLAWAVQQRMTVAQSLEMPFYHPVLEEGLRTALRDLAKELKLHELPCDGDNLRDGPGA
jgi:dihydrolipoamide dehydrogenase